MKAKKKAWARAPAQPAARINNDSRPDKTHRIIRGKVRVEAAPRALNANPKRRKARGAIIKRATGADRNRAVSTLKAEGTID
jgi:hypothetical protein